MNDKCTNALEDAVSIRVYVHSKYVYARTK